MSSWKERYNDPAHHATPDAQLNVGRTKGGESILPHVWSRTVDDIVQTCNINSDSVVLELCCGNGMLLGPVAKLCSEAIGVDFSAPLISELERNFGDVVTAYLADALEYECPRRDLDVILVYFSIQHFSERDALLLIERSIPWLKQGGRLFVGDVPDEAVKWDYINKPEFRKDYFTRLKSDTPKIGHWFRREFFQGLADHLPQVRVEVLDQPAHHINSDIRFDVLITKLNS
ncbi:MAG: class I SAM-dependent methyltransferase [Flavobacteriales bacterium]|nr:class I SAM-dependent methyltransferase [Flavobacteriales bacterium]